MTSRHELILDIGVNYYESARLERKPILKAALDMIYHIAAQPKSSIEIAVKFQWFKADRLAKRTAMPYWDTSEEKTPNQHDLFLRYDKFGPEEYQALKDYCDKQNVEFMATAFDSDSLEQLNPLVKRHKIASADITNHELLSQAASYGKPVILSTGASTEKEIDEALGVLKGCDVTLLHCVLRYPTPIEDAQLWKIPALKKRFPQCKIGYSDHCTASSPAMLVAQSLGAEVIEKHVTATPQMQGNDHYHAIAIKDLPLLVRQLEEGRLLQGSYLDGFNLSLDSQQLAREQARRGVYLKRDVCKGSFWTKDDVEFLRPQGDGISPMEFVRRCGYMEHYERDMQAGEQL